jgi:predicted nucleotidyltransferase
VKRLVAAMIQFGAPSGVIDEEGLMKPGLVTQFGKPPQRIDLLNEIDGVTFPEVWKGAMTVVIDGQKMSVIGLKELRKNKGAMGRKKDEEDLRQLKERDARKLPKTR